MSAAKSQPAEDASTQRELTNPQEGEYVVVARRYRPQTFEELLGQEHVARALSNAIRTGRVGHAYLFTGARGVGKTSAARILAKALNCERGPTPTPCNECDSCLRISTGDDVDVLEIDGASNRGIDEIRQLRQNVSIRPSRSRFKIYIIDEVHMLTAQAFNALLKTLEEPPEHVKFIFCTTEADKIPITILSRCQRFDFASIQPQSIAARLAQIVEREQATAEPAALDLLARRANGSMRDSQSLLEQLLAFGGTRITLADVNRLLGTAADDRVGRLLTHIVDRNPAGALAELDSAMADGVDVGQLLEQMLGYLRDAMVAACGASPDTFLHSSPEHSGDVRAIAERLGLETVLAAMQLIDHTLARLRYATHGRVLAELALVRLCSLEDVEELSQLIGQLRQPAEPGGSASRALARASTAAAPTASTTAAPKKKFAEVAASGYSQALPAGVSPGSAADPVSSASQSTSTAILAATDSAPSAVVSDPTEGLSAEPIGEPATAASLWVAAVNSLPGIAADQAGYAVDPVLLSPGRLAVTFPWKYNSCKTFCERPEQLGKLSEALSQAAGRPVSLELRLQPADQAGPEPTAPRSTSGRPGRSRQELLENPLVRRTVELFNQQAEGVQEIAPPKAARTKTE